MKLLSPLEVQKVKAQQQTYDILHAQESKKAEEQIRHSLALAEADFNEALARHKEQWIVEETAFAKRKGELESSITTLEERRRVALLPVSVLQKQAEDKLAEGIEYLAGLKMREEETQDLRERLEDKLDEVGAKEQQLIEKEQALGSRLKGIELQSEQVKTAVSLLTERTTQLLAKELQATADIDKRKTSVALIEHNIVARKTILDDEQARLKLWAINLSTLADTLEKKRLEVMRPIEQIVNEAKADRVSAAKALADAQEERKNATITNQKAQTDYDKLLNSLKERADKLSTDELSLTQRSKLMQGSEQKLLDGFNDLRAQQQALKAQNDQLTKSIAMFEQTKAETTAFIALQQKEATDKLNQVNLNLSKIETYKAQTQAIFDENERIKNLTYSKEAEVDDKTATLTELTRINKKTIEDAKAALAEVEAERQTFAQWRNEAEKLVTDRELVTNTKQKVLANKEVKLTRQESFLSRLDKKLKDERALLTRNWNELRSKYPHK